MQLGMIGLGRMGANMVRRLMKGGIECVVYDLNAENVKSMAREGAVASSSLADLKTKLKAPRAVWIMVPAGKPTEDTVNAVAGLLEKGDTIIDGGNSMFKDDIRRAEALKPRGLFYVDAGTSGGVFGLERGYCLMVGGESEAVTRLEPVFKVLAPGRGSIERTPGRKGMGSAEDGYLHCGPAGAGHYVKMIHNGIEYGLMQAYAEGFDILESAPFPLPVPEIAEVWRRGSVVTSWLLDLTAAALAEDPRLESYTGAVEDSGEGRWTVQAAIEQSVPAEIITASLFARFRSRKAHTFAEKVLSAMRRKFGGHVEKSSGG